MKTLFKKQNDQLDFSKLNPILTSGVAVGVAIANHSGLNPKIGGTLSLGISLLVTGLLEASKEDVSQSQRKNF